MLVLALPLSGVSLGKLSESSRSPNYQFLKVGGQSKVAARLFGSSMSAAIGYFISRALLGKSYWPFRSTQIICA